MSFEGGVTGSAAASFTLKKATRPAAPVITTVSGGELKPDGQLCWNAAVDPDPNDVIVYELQISETTAFSPVVLTIGNIGSLCYRIGNAATHLRDDSKYYWRIRATDSFTLESGWSSGQDWFVYNAENDRPNAVSSGFSPLANSIITASGAVLLSWDAATDPDVSDTSAKLRYQVHLTTDPGFATYETLTSAEGTANLSVTQTLTENARYFWRVVTMDDEGAKADPSAQQNFWINRTAEIPTTPTGLSPTDCAVELSATGQLCWNAADDLDPNEDVRDYRVQIATDANFSNVRLTALQGGTALCATLQNLSGFTNLTEDTRYYWRVQAVSDQNSAYSTAACFTLNKQNNPPNPVSAGISPMNGATVQTVAVQFCWQAATDPDLSDGSATLRYRFRLTKDASWTTVVRDETTAANQTCLTHNFSAAGSDDGAWYWELTTLDDSSTPSSVTRQSFRLDAANSIPTAPTLTGPCGSEIRQRQPLLSISPASDADDPTLFYQYHVAMTVTFSDTAALSGNGEGLNWQVNRELRDSCAPYYWRVRAWDGKAYGPWAQACVFVMNAVPEPPTEFALVEPPDRAVLRDASAVLNWTDSADPDCGPITYDLYLSQTPTFEPNATVIVRNLTESAYSINPGTNMFVENGEFYWKAQAVDNSSAKTAAAQTWRFYINRQEEAPSAPTDPARVEHDRLRWTASVDPDPLAEITYTVEFSLDEQFTQGIVTVRNIRQTELSVASVLGLLQAGADYFWHVVAVDQTGLTSFWSSAAIMEARLPVELAAFTAEAQANTIALRWEIAASSDLAGFHVWRKAETQPDFVRLTTELIVAPGTVFTYVDEGIAPDQSYAYRLEDVDAAGVSTFHTSITVRSAAFPATPALRQNYPNPFMDKTVIGFAVPAAGQVRLRIYDVSGRLVKELVDKNFPIGYYTTSWDGLNENNERVSDGIYLYALEIGGQKWTRRLILSK